MQYATTDAYYDAVDQILKIINSKNSVKINGKDIQMKYYTLQKDKKMFYAVHSLIKAQLSSFSSEELAKIKLYGTKCLIISVKGFL